MSKGLLDYAAKNPCTEEAAPPAPKIRDVVHDEQEAAELMQTISDQIRQAAPPSNVLRKALSLIGILAQNEEWAETMRSLTSEIYDLNEPEKQEGLFPMAEADRLLDKRKEIQEKMIRSLTRAANSCAALEKEIRATIENAAKADDVSEVVEADEIDIPL